MTLALKSASPTPRLERPEEKYPVTLDGPRKSIRSFLFKPDTKKAAIACVIGLLFHILSYSILYYSLKVDNPYLLVLGWMLAGMSVTSLFVLGHDCAHASFLKNNKLNDLFGHFFLLFSFYPYFAWKYSHNAHHANTNNLTSSTSDVYFDNAWIPFTLTAYVELRSKHPLKALVYRWTRYFPPLGSLIHNIIFHAAPSKFIESHRKKVYFSYFVLFAGLLCLSLSLRTLTGSWMAIVHFLIIPGILFQFWMSYYTYIHHTSSEIKFYEQKDWTPYKGQVLSTYNMLNPKLISFLHFHIDIHTPHHVSTAIPCYHLKEAYNDLLKSEYGNDIKEGSFKFSYFFKILRTCHVWDEKRMAYVSFQEIENAT